jgi:hypothetical protein
MCLGTEIGGTHRQVSCCLLHFELPSWALQVHLDFGLVVPKLSVWGMRCAVSDLLDLAPVNKVPVLSGTSPMSSNHAE